MPRSAMSLFEINLPAGDCAGFSIDVPGWTGHTNSQKLTSRTWLGEHTGVVFRGKGKGVTHVVGSTDSTIIFDRHPGTVRLENLTVHCGSRHGIFGGLAHPDRPIEPKFRLETQNVDVVASGVLSTWGVFTYQCDVDMRDGEIDVRNGLEHAYYGHGSAGKGWRMERMHFRSAAEGFKVRSDMSETR